MIQSSELILNPDGSVYHLNLQPQHIAHDIIFVGDQDRVSKITQHFDSIEFTTQKREFKTQTGILKGKRLTVISTGIGADNIDIVMNELDALVNIDLKSRTIKPKHSALNIVRIGTSGALQPEINVDDFVISSHALGLDNMLRSYKIDHITNEKLEKDFINHCHWDTKKGQPYAVTSSLTLMEKFNNPKIVSGITATASGFYGPQGRVLRLAIQDQNLNEKMDSFVFEKMKITNLEMETAAIYGLGKLLGHHCLSMNAIIANRASKKFSNNPSKTIEKLIDYTLNKIV